VIPPTEPINGVSQLEHSRRWWETFVNIPVEDSPFFDETGEEALRGLVGSLWYLPGSFESTSNRAVTLPAGTTIFASLVNFLGENVSEDPSATLAQLLARGGLPPAVMDELIFEVDGQAVLTRDQLLLHRQTSDPNNPVSITVTSPQNLYVGLDLDPTRGAGDPNSPASYPVSIPAVVDGYWVAIQPFAPGSVHTIRLGGASMGRPAGDFDSVGTFTVTTVPEPSTIALLGMCVMILAGVRRWRRAV
jgi:hypothetical protein